MGTHSVPMEDRVSTSGAFATVVTGAIALQCISGLVNTPVANAATVLDNIASCESGGNSRATNGTHFGLFQFDLPTWRSVGGTGNPMDATPSEQYARAEALLTKRGTQPWDASKSCWSKKPVDGVAVKVEIAPATVEVKVRPSPRPRVAPHIHDQLVAESATKHSVVWGDNLSILAEKYGIKGGWRTLYNLNRNSVSDPNLIYPGQVLRLH